MSENAPLTPPGGVPPKPVEAAKVQPKKETVRISLPPKPTAAPTIKIPSPAAPTAATAAAAAPMASAAPSAPAAAPAPPRAAAAPAAPAPAAPSRPAPMPRPSAGSSVSGLDKGLAIATAIVGILVVVRLFLI